MSTLFIVYDTTDHQIMDVYADKLTALQAAIDYNEQMSGDFVIIERALIS